MSKVTTEITTNYIPGEDITIVWQLLYVDGENIQRTIVGWYHGEPDEKSTKDFSHLGVMGQYLWDDLIIPNTTEVDKPKNFKVLNYEYLNTGGNCMVGIFTVYLPDLKQTAYALTNEVGCSIVTVDYISNEVEIEDYDEVTIDRCDFDDLCNNATYFELYRYCLNEYTKSDCRYFGHTYAWPYHLLSDELQSNVAHDYMKWLNENNNGCIPTDGINIVEHPDYFKPEEDERLKSIKDFRKWHDDLITNATDEEMQAFYDKQYRLYFCGRRTFLPFDAETFNKINDLLDSVVKEW